MINPLSSFFRRRLSQTPGAPPGIEYAKDVNQPPSESEIRFQVIDYCADHIESRDYDSVDELIADPRPEWSTSRWIDVQGLHPYVIRQLQQHYHLHTLAAEDALNTPQRPKIEEYEGSLFVVLRMLRMEQERLINEQVSFFLVGDTVITVQEAIGDVWENVRQRMQRKNSRFRIYGTSYLLYALIDAIIDHTFPLLDTYFEKINRLEEEILSQPADDAQTRIHNVKRELVFLRQSLWPVRDVVAALHKDDYDLIPDEVETYMRDVYDHSIQAIEAVELYRETANGLQDLLMAASANRANEVMKALTIMASLFLPITFFAGVYGMNFEHIPELGWKFAYPVFWGICIATTGALLCFFKRKGWL